MKQELICFLNKYNNPKSGIVIQNAEEYVDKLLRFSTIITYYSEGTLLAFISYYKNNYDDKIGFLTMILVDEPLQGKGIGEMLLMNSIADLKMQNFEYYFLEVLKSNRKAIKMYEKYGFEYNEDRNNSILMRLKL